MSAVRQPERWSGRPAASPPPGRPATAARRSDQSCRVTASRARASRRRGQAGARVPATVTAAGQHTPHPARRLADTVVPSRARSGPEDDHGHDPAAVARMPRTRHAPARAGPGPSPAPRGQPGGAGSAPGPGHGRSSERAGAGGRNPPGRAGRPGGGMLIGAALRPAGPGHARPRGRRFRGGGGGSRRPGLRARRRRRGPR